LFLLAKIVKTRGNKGEVVCTSSSSISGILKAGDAVLLRRGEKSREAEVENVRVVNGSQLVKFKGLGTMTEAYGLIGCEVYGYTPPRNESSEGESPDIIGWMLYDQYGHALGEIEDQLDRVIQPLLVVSNGDGREHLVPLVKEWLLEKDAVSKRVVMSLPDGLIGIN